MIGLFVLLLCYSWQENLGLGLHRNHAIHPSLKQINAGIDLTLGKWFRMALLTARQHALCRSDQHLGRGGPGGEEGEQGPFEPWLRCLLSVLETNCWNSEQDSIVYKLW